MAALPKSKPQEVPFSQLQEYAYCWVRAGIPEVGWTTLKVRKITPISSDKVEPHALGLYYIIEGQPKRLWEFNAIYFEYNKESRKMDHHYFYLSPGHQVLPAPAF